MRDNRKLLTISKDPVLVSLLQEALGQDGYEVISTRHTGSRLRDLIESESPDFIVQDIEMPTLDGIEVCLHLLRCLDDSALAVLSQIPLTDHLVAKSRRFAVLC